MKYKFVYITILISNILFATLSCSNDKDGLLEHNIPENAKIIAINLSVRTSNDNDTESTPTRATEEEGNKYNSALNENKIDNVDVFFFNADGTLKWHVPPTSLQKTGDELSAILKAIVPYDKIADYQNKSFKIVVIANHTATLPANPTLAQLRAVVQETSGINTSGTPQSKFLMDGEVETSLITWGSSVIYTVPATLSLKRAAAKIRLRIATVDVRQKENGTEVAYTMEGAPEVKLVHYIEKTSLLQGSPYVATSSDWKTEDYQPLVSMSFPDKTNPNDNTHNFQSTPIPFYAYENNWTDEAENETYLSVKVNLKAGSGTAKAYYYRIPVNYRLPLPSMTDEQKAGLHQLQRNYLYDIVSSIKVLGSEDEGEPVDLAATIGVEPWTEISIDGDIRSAHYLVVKELHPIMPNQNNRDVQYLSDLPVSIRIDKTEYEYYDQYGRLIKVEETVYDETYNIRRYYMDNIQHDSEYISAPNKFDGTTVSFDEAILSRKLLKINHRIPVNYVPFEIFFTVMHIMPSGETGTPLSQKVQVTQYPPKYVTGSKSPGYKANSGDPNPHADFRFHDVLGAGNQVCDVFFKITTVVNVQGESIGDPTDANGYTKSDEISNKTISPQFIIATQHGMSPPNLPQTGSSGNLSWAFAGYKARYGPFSNRFPDSPPYYRGYEANYDTQETWQPRYRSYSNATERCARYFEGEYGMDGYYTEYYAASFKGSYTSGGLPIYDYASRSVYKTFKNKGRWRVPTAKELEQIDKIQDAPDSAVKSLLWGQFYWTAQSGMAYNFTSNEMQNQSGAAVRCVFDTYKLPNE